MKIIQKRIVLIIMLMLTLLLFAVGCSNLNNSSPEPQDVTLETKSGNIRGTKTDDVAIYKGIPYAKPPVGDLRFKPPVAADAWSDTLDCTEYASSAPQPATQSIATPDEDCLSLNVWSAAQKGDKKPVYVFIHGGAYANGSGSKTLYDCTNFTKDGIVGVTINYRLNALGFLGLNASKEECGTTGNFGTLDQIEALKWVQNNIEDFGGDPNNVTIGGESAGSFSVSALIMSPLAKGLFNQAIMESGCLLDVAVVAPYSKGDPDTTAKISESFAQIFGADDSPEGLAKLRKIDADALSHLSVFDRDATLTNIFGFWPINDGVVLPSDPQAALKSGNYNNVRLLVGYNSDEGSIFLPRNLDEGDYKAYAYKILGSEAAEAALSRWPVDEEHSATQRARDLLKMAGFRLGSQAFADTFSQNGQDVYCYEFAYTSPVVPDAHHAAELSYVFGNQLNILKLDDAGKLVASDTHSAWANFIKSGNPNNGTDLKSDVSWEKYSTESGNTMKIDDQWSLEGLSQKEDLDFLKSILYKK